MIRHAARWHRDTAGGYCTPAEQPVADRGDRNELRRTEKEEHEYGTRGKDEGPSREEERATDGAWQWEEQERKRDWVETKRKERNGRRMAATQCRWQFAHPTDPVSSLLFLPFRRLSSPLTARQPRSPWRLGLVSCWNCSNGNECVILTASACHSSALLSYLSLPPSYLPAAPALSLTLDPRIPRLSIADADVYDLGILWTALRRHAVCPSIFNRVGRRF